MSNTAQTDQSGFGKNNTNTAQMHDKRLSENEMHFFAGLTCYFCPAMATGTNQDK